MKKKKLPHIVIVDDEPAMREGLRECLESTEYEITTCPDVPTCRDLVDKQTVDLVITDLVMPGQDGMELLEWIGQNHGHIPVIMVTGFSTVSSAVEAMRRGAVDYIPKPFELDEVRITVRKTLKTVALERDNRRMRRQLDALSPRGRIVGQSATMRKLVHEMEQVARSDLPVLITGETGTGKELLAREIHAHSARSEQAFLSINCAALPETLVESELFGHVRGAFTGAVENRDGLFQAADGGTLLLDEVGDISLSAQARLLRVLQNGEVKRLGQNAATFVDVRVLAATNQPLEELIEQKRFREDLYFRLNVVNLEIPPLRDRREDVPVLAQYMMQTFRQDRGLSEIAIASETMERLAAYDWPGNVRELENVMRRGAALCDGSSLAPADLPPHVNREPQAAANNARSLEEVEHQHILAVLLETQGNITVAARILETSRPTLRSKVEKYRIDLERIREERS